MRRLSFLGKLSFLFLVAFLLGCGGGGGGGGVSPPASAPDPPAGLTANPGDNLVTLTWNPALGATSYNVYYSTTAGVNKTTGTKLTGTTSPRVIPALTNGTAYYFVVTAVNGNGESLESAEKSATPTPAPPPDVPTNIRATAGVNQVTVSWSSVAGATSYNIYYATTAGVTTSGTNLAGATSPWIVSGLTNGTMYYFVVTAVNANGESGVSVEVSATPAAAVTLPPLAPGGVSATPGNAQVSVGWSAVTGATSYNLYFSTSSGVTKGNGTKIAGVTSPKVVTGLSNGTTYFFVVTAVGAAGESTESAEKSATPVAPPGGFSQADITGTWDVVSIQSGGNAGWFHATGAFDASGSATSITNFLDSTGNTNPGVTLKWTIDSNGVVSQFENNVNTGFHGKMSSDKKLISWTGTQDVSTHTVQMTIARKRTGTVFGNTDVVSIQYAYHALTTGSDNNWEYGTGNTNASRQLSTTSTTLPAGYPPAVGLPLLNYDTFSVSPAGIVTLGNDITFYGLMTDDKKVIFTIRSNQLFSYYWLGVITVTGQTFTQADYAGTIPFAALRNSAPFPTWAYGVGSIDAAGNGSYLSYADSLGSPTPPAYIRLLSTTGVIADPADATFHGQLSYNKDITVQTNTTSTNNYGMTICIK